MAIVKAIHSSPLDLEYPHVTVGFYTHSPLCRHVCFRALRWTSSERNRLDKTKQKYEYKYEYSHEHQLVFSYIDVNIFSLICPFPHPCLPPSYSILHAISVLTENLLPTLMFTYLLLLSYHPFSLQFPSSLLIYGFLFS